MKNNESIIIFPLFLKIAVIFTCFYNLSLVYIKEIPIEEPGDYFYFLNLLISVLFILFYLVGLKFESERIFVYKLFYWKEIHSSDIKNVHTTPWGLILTLRKGNLLKIYLIPLLMKETIKRYERKISELIEQNIEKQDMISSSLFSKINKYFFLIISIFPLWAATESYIDDVTLFLEGYSHRLDIWILCALSIFLILIFERHLLVMIKGNDIYIKKIIFWKKINYKDIEKISKGNFTYYYQIKFKNKLIRKNYWITLYGLNDENALDRVIENVQKSKKMINSDYRK